jgi:glycosyltransferase involved in cell wall biosynthesis
MTHLGQEREPRTVTGSREFSPLVSIGMPVFDCEKTLATTIRSILNQTYGNWELLLMEDGSSDRTLEVARSFSDPRISVFTDHSHKGLVPRLNQAVVMSRGKYFARMDADDVAYPERLERQVEFLSENANVDLVGCGILVFGDEGTVLGTRRVIENHSEICRRPWAGFQLPHPTWMGRVEWFRAHQYDSRTIRAEDQELLFRTYSTSCFSSVPEILQGYREGRLLLRRILRGRCSFATAVFRDSLQRKQYLTLIVGVLEQCAKAFVDVFAISTGLNHRILRHRARPVGTEIVERWSEVWAQVQEPKGADVHMCGADVAHFQRIAQ